MDTLTQQGRVRHEMSLRLGPVGLRVLVIGAALLVWEGVARSGLFYEGVFPPLSLVALALLALLSSASFYWHLGVTVVEILAALGIGGAAGVAAGFAFGMSQYLARSLERYVYYVSATPKIIFLPLVIIWFGVDSGSKIGLGAIAAFFPVCLNIAAGVRGVNPIYLRAARTLGASRRQMLTKVYLPAMRGAAINAARLGLAVAIISVLLAETKLAKNGIGYLVTQAFTRYDMPTMYALLFFIFVVSVVINTAMTRMGGGGDPGGGF